MTFDPQTFAYTPAINKCSGYLHSAHTVIMHISWAGPVNLLQNMDSFF